MLYTVVILTPLLAETVFLKLMHITTKCVQFSFNNTMYQQIDDIAMGSPLSAAMVNIFIGFQEEKLFEITNNPLYYYQSFQSTI